MHDWLCGKKNKCRGILDSFCSPRAALVWPAENQMIHLHAQQQSCYTLEHGLTWLSGGEAFPVFAQAQGRAQGFGAAAAGPFLGHVHAHI